jgi:hypothetical protein
VCGSVESRCPIAEKHACLIPTKVKKKQPIRPVSDEVQRVGAFRPSSTYSNPSRSLPGTYPVLLNSPRDYAPYNGAIEESQRELKECLQERLASAMSNPLNHIAAYADSAVNDLNHRIRPCLKDRTSCQVFFEGRIKPKFSRRERKEIYDSIIEKVERILSAMKQSGQAVRESAWRIAVESWLKSRGYIKPRIKTKVSPNFSSFLAHE